MTETVQQRIQSLEQHLSSQPRSPLFAQLAAYYLDNGRTREALDLCDKGLSHHPHFSTGHLIKGKVLLELNMNAEARREFEFVQSSFQGLNSLKQLLQSVPSAETETLVSPAEVQPHNKTEQVAEQPIAEQPAAEQPISMAEDSGPEQILSQFTETTAEPTEVAPFAEVPTVEPPEVFPAASDLPHESPVETQQEPPAYPEFPVPGGVPTSEGEVGESFQSFADRKRGEFFGLENSQSLDEYLAGSQPFEAAPDTVAESTEPPAVAVSASTATTDTVEPQASEDPYATVAPENVEPQGAEDPFAALTVQPAEELVEASPEQTKDDPFAALAAQPAEEPVEASPEQATDDPFAALAAQPAEEPVEASPEHATDDPFAALTSQLAEESGETSLQQVSEDSPDQLQQGFSETGSEEVPPSEETSQERDQIADLADKLQNAKKITPIIDLSERSSVPPSESEAPSSTGFVTPTLAEIYAKQGWYDDAIKAYKTLAVSKPAEKEKFKSRILELEELKRQQESG